MILTVVMHSVMLTVIIQTKLLALILIFIADVDIYQVVTVIKDKILLLKCLFAWGEGGREDWKIFGIDSLRDQLFISFWCSC